MQPGHEIVKTKEHHLTVAQRNHQVGTGVEADVDLMPPLKIFVDHKCCGTKQGDKQQDHRQFVIAFLHGSN